MCLSFPTRPRGAASLRPFLVLFFLSPLVARAQLTWGLTDGTWNNNQSNLAWLNNASAPTPWLVLGTGAVFNGPGGTIAVSAVNASSLTFNSSGYILASGAETSSVITSIGSNFTLTTAAPATIAVTGFVGTGSTTLTKEGSARLGLSSTLVGFSTVQVNAGELAISGTAVANSSTHFVVSPVAGAILSFDLSAIVALIGDLSGGDATAGVVRPGGTGPLTLTLAGTTDATFGGTLQDNGDATLFLAKTGSAHQTLTSPSTYTGTTLVSGGRLTLAGNASLLTSTVSISSGATLALDNTATLVSSRLGDTRPVNLAGGTLSLIGNGAAPTTESAGALNLSTGVSRVETTRTAGQSATLAFTSFNRLGAGSVLEFSGDGTVRFSSHTNTNGLLGGFAVVDNNWATLDGSGNVVAFSAYTASLTSGATTDNVRLTAAPASALSAATTTRNSLALDPTGGDFALNLGASTNVLKLTSGGLLTTGTGTATITGGQLTSNNDQRDLIAFTRGTLFVASPIVNVTNTIGPLTNTSAISLTKAGEGTLHLSGANTYTGDTRVLAGTLSLAGGAALPDASAVSLGTGTTLRLGGSTETIGGLSGSGTVLLDDGQLTIAGSGLTGSAAISTGNGRVTVASASTTDFAGVISGSGGLTHSGTGALTLNTAQTFSGPLRVSAGSVLLGASSLIPDATALELSGGTFGFGVTTIGAGAETLGLLTVSANSILQFSSSTALSSLFIFAGGSTLSWDGQLRITNYTANLDSLRFGTTASGLTMQQLAQIYFETESGLVGAQINSFGFVTPSAIPEPATTATLVAAAALLAAAIYRRRPASVTTPN